ncbi:DUF5017 domain-containing protein [Niastella sp. OAS944]|uniref:DUF5017 domain-containing protein n=1 Tax=Niastella sp. OAS944 TaxID=2664089 RepID=UPI00348DA78A|nr:hypothetical protein [Chitinophagaceae bacterium OAS944]
MQRIFIITIAILFGVACNKKEVDATGFTVTSDKEIYTTSDTVKFAFTGNPWYLTFYSGEPYHRYEYRDRLTADSGKPVLSFTSTATVGKQTNTLRLLVSTNFSGVYDSLNVYQATWTDITAEATLAGAADTKSGNIDLFPYVDGDKPLYIAFKYTGKALTAQRTWAIKLLAVDNVLKDSTSFEVLGIGESTVGFKAVPMKVPAIAWTISTTQLGIKGYTSDANSVADTEGWVVSKPINVKKVLPDTGTPLKNMTTSMSSLNYIYNTAGTYKATFVSANINRYSEKGEVQEIPITVQ